MRKSNTEPIIRIITEAKSKEEAESLQKKFLEEIEIVKSEIEKRKSEIVNRKSETVNRKP